jgi:hypothetical protein
VSTYFTEGGRENKRNQGKDQGSTIAFRGTPHNPKSPTKKWSSACRKLKLDPCLSPSTNINSKWIKDLNIRPETLKLVQERAGNTLEALGIGKDFLNGTPAAQQLRERMDKWNYMKLKSFCTTK